jgi:hypothetical protein
MFNQFYLGSKLYFEIAWKEDFSKDFPIEFYADECTIADPVTRTSFPMIKYGCAASYGSK